MSAFRKVGARRFIVATPLASRTVHAQLDGEADLVMALTRATVAETCTYRDDVIASDLVAVDLLYRRPHRRAI
jgi:predicted phosphoribosyltransferase